MKKCLVIVLIGMAAAFLGLLIWPELHRERPTPVVNIDMLNLVAALEKSREIFGTYPTGTWQEISQALMGKNQEGHVFIDPKWTNRQGELVDPWGTPFSLTIETNVILKSAGPNRRFGDKDDVVRVKPY